MEVKKMKKCCPMFSVDIDMTAMCTMDKNMTAMFTVDKNMTAASVSVTIAGD